jgi:dephospho-CoA kinase
MDEAEKRQRADYVLENDGDLHDLRRQVQALVETLRQA